MQYITTYQSPLGEILLAADEAGLIGLWFDGEKFYADSLDPEHEERNVPVFDVVKKWLDIYFSGHEPDFMPPVHMIGSEFRQQVWKILREIPYGETITYGALAKRLARERPEV
ncbi:MAG: methylated-DNA--[protein]-cysteine S-methyltransferase [Lachnospiraceae bacterium]|nr:methylated-DNA--[protein]-cysteine S-methyltransferase [Lachnospiraceae bacterium]